MLTTAFQKADVTEVESDHVAAVSTSTVSPPKEIDHGLENSTNIIPDNVCVLSGEAQYKNVARQADDPSSLTYATDSDEDDFVQKHQGMGGGGR